MVEGGEGQPSKLYLDLPKLDQQLRLKDRLKKYCQKVHISIWCFIFFSSFQIAPSIFCTISSNNSMLEINFKLSKKYYNIPNVSARQTYGCPTTLYWPKTHGEISHSSYFGRGRGELTMLIMHIFSTSQSTILENCMAECSV